MTRFVVEGLNEVPAAARLVIANAGNHTIWVFDGEMGAGKTTLIKAIGKELGILDNVTSPTFSLVNEYATGEGKRYYHFDFYRINSEEEALDIGVDEYFGSGEICFVEWASKIPHLIPDHYLKISINLVSENSRELILTSHDRPTAI